MNRPRRPRRKLLRWLLAALLLAAGAAALLDWGWWQREHRFDREILAASQRHGLDPALVKAVVWRESWFDPSAVGSVGELGLMQITETTGLEWADEQRVAPFEHRLLLDPARNTRCGAWYLAKLLRRYPQCDDPLPYALADYNAGRANVLRWAKGPAATNSAAFIAAIPFPTTRRYVEAVRERRDHYRREIPAAGRGGAN